MADELGWWAWDAERRALVHRASGEEVRHLGSTAVEGAGSWPWHLLEYCHETRLYPLLVEIRQILTSDGGYHSGPQLVWRLDHERSAALWRERNNGEQRYPSFGLWRRVDYAAMDALLSWPVEEVSGRPDELAMNAGWVNDGWHSDHYGRYFIRRDLLQKPFPLDRHVLFRLDAEPPRWRLTFGPYEQKWLKINDAVDGKSYPSYVRGYMAPAQRHLRSARGGLIVHQTYSPHRRENFDGLAFYSDVFCYTLKIISKKVNISAFDPLDIIYNAENESIHITGLNGIALLTRDGKPIDKRQGLLMNVDYGLDQFRMWLAGFECFRHALVEVDEIGSVNRPSETNAKVPRESSLQGVFVGGMPGRWPYSQRKGPLTNAVTGDHEWSSVFGE